MNTIYFYIFITLSILIYIYFYKLSKDTLNPIGMMSFIWLFVASICHLNIGAYQNPWSLKTYIVVIITEIILVTVGTISLNRKNSILRFSENNDLKENEINLTNKFHIFFIIWTFLCYISMIYVTIENGFDWTYVFTNDLTGNKGEWVKSNNYIISIIIGTVPHCSILAYFEIKNKINQTRRQRYFCIIYIIISLFFMLFVMCSRGTAMIAILGMVFLSNRKKTFSLSKWFMIIGLCVFAYSIYALFRWSTIDTSLYVYSGNSSSPLVNSMVNNVVYQYQNLDTLIQRNYDMTYYRSVFEPILKILGLSDSRETFYISVAGNNANTFIFKYYQDLKMLGVIIYVAFDAWLMTMFYNKANKNEAYSLIVAFFQKGICSVFFGDYILVLNTQWLPWITVAIMIKLCKTSVKEKSSYSIRYNPKKFISKRKIRFIIRRKYI